jgi:N,N'-diacetylchitobiose transport system permease protein
MLLPAVLVLGTLLGTPLVRMVVLSFQKFGRRELQNGGQTWIGLANYRYIFKDDQFWTVLKRTIVFAGVCVVVTMVLGTLIALMLNALGKRMRTAVSVSLLFAWATPAITAVIVWKWIFDTDAGVVNTVLTALPGLPDYTRHGWFLTPMSAIGIIGVVIVWGAIPFVALTLYAGLTQIPIEMFEAARIDGAGFFRMFFSVTFPMLKPLFLIIISLSVIWDFRVFTQVYVMTRGGPDDGTMVLGLLAYNRSIGTQQYGRGAAIAVIMVVLLLLITSVYIRALLRGEEEA